MNTRDSQPPGQSRNAASESGFAEGVLNKTGQNVFLCNQCLKCSAGCPLAEHFDLMPHQVLRAVQLGQMERVLASRAIWLCASCQTCTTRCPQGLDLARLMDALKAMALAQGVKPAVPAVAAFQSVFLRNLRLLGRSYEPSLIVEMNLRTRRPLKDVGLGLGMIARAKIKLLPSIARLPQQPARQAQPGEIAYYPGCSLHSLSSELDASTRAVSAELGLALVEPEGWTCCGSSAAHGRDHVLATTLPMQNLALIEKSGFAEVIAPCSACYFRFKSALHDTRGEQALQSAVTERIGYTYQDRLRVLSVLDLLTDKVGIEAIARRVTRPLHGLRVVSYYGCLLTRPPAITGAEHAENPQQMDAIVRTLGAEAVDWSCKTDCCGGSLSLTETSLALDLTRKLLLAARALDADVITTSCPMCHVNLDARQAQLGLDFSIPVLYITQLMGLAFGLPARRLALGKHVVSPKSIQQRAWRGHE
jgi:heterodisulfide reductase subunit B